MIILLVIGAVLALATVVMSYIELIPFFKAMRQLNDYTEQYPSIKNKILYFPRFIVTLKYAGPVVFDTGIAVVCGLIGLSGGVIGALIGLTISFIASLMLKIHRHFIAPKLDVNKGSWRYNG